MITSAGAAFVAAALLLTGCGGGDSGDSSESSASVNDGDKDSHFGVKDNDNGRVQEVYDQGDGVVDITNQSDPKNSVSVRVELPGGWKIGTPPWDGPSPNVTKAIFYNDSHKDEIETEKNGKKVKKLVPSIYVSIKPVDLADDKGNVNLRSIPLEEVAGIKGFEQASRGEMSIGSQKNGYYYTGTWNPSSGQTARNMGTVAFTVIPSGDKHWLVAFLAQKSSGGAEKWWQDDLSSFLESVKYKTEPTPDDK